MSHTKRLGPQDPLSWIRDTREEKVRDESHRNYLSIGPRDDLSLFAKENKHQRDITIVIKGEGRERVLAVEVTIDKKGVSKIQIKTRESHQLEEDRRIHNRDIGI